jgi:flagellar hook-associated protein 1 FlgK
MTDLALSSAVSSLLLLQKQMSVTSSNISNANTAGYTAESEQVSSVVIDGVGGGVQDLGTTSNVNQFLEAQINTANAVTTQASTYNTYYQSLQQAMGQISQSDTGGNDISSQIATVQTDLSQLAATPQNTSLGNAAIGALDDLASNFRSTSQQIQSLRTQADQQITDTVTDANTQLDTINQLNTQIATAQAQGQSTAALDDQRSTALQALSGDLGIGYYTNQQGAVQIYTTSGESLLTGNVVNHLSHTSVTIADNSSYPSGGINGIMVGNTDITSEINTGKLAALVQQRDQELPAAQSSLDYLAQQFSAGLNAVSNLGSASPPPSSLTSASPASYQGTDPVTPSQGSDPSNVDAEGNPVGDLVVRIATTDSNGQVQSYQDVDLSGAQSVNDVITDINSAFGTTVAGLNGSGQLTLTSPTAGQGIAVSTLAGTLNNTDFSSFFHLNDVITGGNSAATISVNPAMLKNSNLLPVATLNSTVPAPTVPFSGVGSGDGSIAQSMASALLNNQSFTTATATGTNSFYSASEGLNISGSFTINGGSVPVAVQVTSGMTPSDIATAINNAAIAAGAQTTDPTTGQQVGLTAQVTGNGIYQLQINSGGNTLSFSNVTGNALSSLGISSLSPTGHLGAATTTYGGFASNLIADVASRASTAQSNSTQQTTTLSALTTTFSNQSGVNVDQQTANLTQLQNLYAASARVITTDNAMFSSLIQAVGG